MKESRAAFVLAMEARVLDHVSGNTVETVYSLSTGYPLVALAPEFIGRNDEWMREHGFDPEVESMNAHR